MHATSLFRLSLLWLLLTTNAVVAQSGEELKVGDTFRLWGAQYRFDKDDLTNSSKDSLKVVAAFLKDNPYFIIEIGVHTDTRVPNPYPYAKRLDISRANACMQYFIGQGISPARITAKGYLDDEPIISEAEIGKMKTEEEKEIAHMQNRRTEIKIISNNHQLAKQIWFDRVLDSLNANHSNLDLSVPNISFHYDKSDLWIDDKYNAQDSLIYIYKLLKKFPNTVIEIGVHRDTRGSNRYSNPITQKRAYSIARALNAWGIPRERIVPKGYGEERPLITDNEIGLLSTEGQIEEAHRKNRRVTVRILSNDYVPQIWFDKVLDTLNINNTNTLLKVPQVLFLYDSDELIINEKHNAQDSIAYIYKLLKKFPETILEINVHRDSRHDYRKYSRLPTQSKAETIVSTLVDWGIAKERLVPRGCGIDKPLYSDNYIKNLPTEKEQEAAHAANRRIEVRILSNDYKPKN
jgi:outer membrane protein OmpA-like peptidoglycan-associated protein